MFGRVSLVLLIIVAGALAAASAAYQEDVADEVVSTVQSLVSTSSAASILPQVAAYAVFDPSDGTLLLAHNEDTPLAIASITKLFSAMAIQDVFDLDGRTTLGWSDLNAVGTAGRLEFGQEYTYRELLFPLLLSSSNNAALTFERRARDQGTPLPEVMEQLAAQAGYPAVQFADASGLSARNQSTARDLAGLVAATRQQYSYVYAITSLRSYVGPYLAWGNNSPFIEDVHFSGGKHGFTNAAGRTAVALFTETIDGIEVEIGYIILGRTDLSGDMSHLRSQAVDLIQWQ